MLVKLVDGQRVLLAVDDSSTKRYGPKVQGAGIHHNPMPGPADQKFLYGPIWVTISLVLRHPLWQTLGFTGMRAGECCRLRSEDVDLKNGWIYIVSRPGFETKTGQSWKVPIHPRLQQILEQIPKGKRKWFFAAPPSQRYPDGGHPLNMNQVCENLKKILRKLGIPVGRKNGGFTLHSLRASFKTICVNARIPREVVDEWQNHARERPPASDAYYRLSDEESQAFMFQIPFGAADSPGSGEAQGGT